MLFYVVPQFHVSLCLKHQVTETGWFILYLSQANTGKLEMSTNTVMSALMSKLFFKKVFFVFISVWYILKLCK